jgi:ABC-type transporter Mla subunit MlaD
LRRLRNLDKRIINFEEVLKLLMDFLDSINDRLEELNKKMDTINENIRLIADIKEKIGSLEHLYE